MRVNKSESSLRSIITYSPSRIGLPSSSSRGIVLYYTPLTWIKTNKYLHRSTGDNQTHTHVHTHNNISPIVRDTLSSRFPRNNKKRNKNAPKIPHHCVDDGRPADALQTARVNLQSRSQSFWVDNHSKPNSTLNAHIHTLVRPAWSTCCRLRAQILQFIFMRWQMHFNDGNHLIVEQTSKNLTIAGRLDDDDVDNSYNDLLSGVNEHAWIWKKATWFWPDQQHHEKSW